MNLYLVLLLFLLRYLCCVAGNYEGDIKTLHGVPDLPSRSPKIFSVNDNDDAGLNGHHKIHKRSVVSSTNNSTISSKITYLNDTHKQLMVNWVGEGSNVIICLAKDSTTNRLSTVSPSAVYISYDYGDSYKNKTELFKLKNGEYATLDKFYNHPKYNTHYIFADVKHNVIFTTTNHGRDIKRIDLSFTPSEIHFHELLPSVFVILDKNDTQKRLWITEEYGRRFRLANDYVKSVHWIKKNSDDYSLVVQRLKPFSSTIIYTSSLFLTKDLGILSTNVKEIFFKGDYIFTTRKIDGKLELYVSYKLEKPIKCVFDTKMEHRSYFIVDVTNNRALVAISHKNNQSNLYVSENLNKNSNVMIRFTLSLENVFCYFPNSTWHETWIHHVSDEAFADIYKIEGLNGIYIASKVIIKPINYNLSPQHLSSVITFDHGRSWHLIKSPERDILGQPTHCSIFANCSLHLSQKFNQLYPDTKSISILSSKSAPGIIIATGVMGTSLKGHYGVYISTDAGITWRQTLRDLYFFNMGDHGGILTAVKYFKTIGETRHILYSTDEGETWNQTIFHNEQLRLYGLMTEPGENTTIFTMFGSLPKEHQWIIIKLDFIKAFKYNCTNDDYKLWSPSQNNDNRAYIPCVMGQQITYQRRMPHSNCYNGLNFDKPISILPCDCDFYDYECDYGFLKSDNGNCIRNITSSIDPYKIPDDCKPGGFYYRTKGYRKIQGDVCVDGFQNHYLPEVIPCPFKEINDFLLFAQREKISRFNLLTNTLEELPIKKLKNVIAIDFDMKNNCVYWADIALDTIGRQCFNNNSSEAEILVSVDLSSIEGMALDWISNNLYFVDGLRSKIELIRTDINHSGRMRKTILGAPILKKPRGIALHPKFGYMFWTDWSTDDPSVNRANLDGTNTIKLFGKPKVEWPNGIAIDYIAERIYWVDARQDYIASSDLHGDFFKKIISHDEVVSHPFAIAVFKNSMYWDDWKRNSIFSADKDNFKGVEILQRELPGLMDLKVFAHGLQVGTNECINNSCSYICVGAPKNKYSCLCPDGMLMRNGECLCPGGVKPFQDYTCPKFDQTCSLEHFTCRNGYCIPKGWRCDGENDCKDNSDEEKCGITTCPTNYFICGDGKCLPQYWRCDFDADCSDGTDELNCPKQNCTDNQFTCNNGRCISKTWRCDGENDCRDGSDELNCTPAEPSTCKKDEFQCSGGALLCLPPTWRCDGETDCRDGSDEQNCINNTCSEMQFSCGTPSNRCIYLTWVCDGDIDCPGSGKDELNCTSPSSSSLPSDDKIENLPSSPSFGTCQDWMFKCLNNKCIPSWWKCDGSDDCNDNSDEIGCHHQDTIIPSDISPTPIMPEITSIKPLICPINMFYCSSTGSCIALSWVCDGTPDCKNGEDELNCDRNLNCTKDQFKCRLDGSCIPINYVCNSKNDCPDGTDEIYCMHYLPDEPATPSCSLGYFPCDDNCKPLTLLCNGIKDCNDGYDELNCTNATRIYQVLQMGVDERGINSTTLLLYWWIPTPTNGKLEFLPSISKINSNKWLNKTWIQNTEYTFYNLEPFTKYNLTVYAKIQNNDKVFPPAKYFIATTDEGIPSEPWNVTIKQKNSSHILIKWNKPKKPNGIITNYQIQWYPPKPSIKLKLNGNETEHLLTAEFQPNVTYYFYVIAYNRKYESGPSQLATLTFQSDSDVDIIHNLKVTNKSDTKVTLKWVYDNNNKTIDGFIVKIIPEKPLPLIPQRTTKYTNITIDNLSPGTSYTFEVFVYKKSLNGPISSVDVTTDGNPLLEVPGIQGRLVKEIGTTVNLRWDKVKDPRVVTWVYGVFYGISEEELLEKPRLKTTNLSAVITDLNPCEIYTFAVGIVGPWGYGPIPKRIEIMTPINKKAPPKSINVTSYNENPLMIRVSWTPSCPTILGNISYIIHVNEKVHNTTWYIQEPKNLYHELTLQYGGIYGIRVATEEPGAIYTQEFTYHAPSILPPYGTYVQHYKNGSYVLKWNERDLPKIVGPYKYEVLVSPDKVINEKTAQRFIVEKPPFIYTNSSSQLYTFSVRTITSKGFSSPSELISMASINESFSSSSSSSSSSMSNWIIGLIFSGFLIAVALTVFIFIKHRRLKSSFTRFTNSHYDTRSGAATFDDNNGLEEDDSPQITGFSDDEPLVIA